MSIKRITDLEQLSVAGDNLEKFKRSFIEISYNDPPVSNPEAHQYVSRGMKIADFISALGFGGEEKEDVLSGDFIYNDGITGGPNDYTCQLNFGDAAVQAKQFTVQENDDNQIAVFDENGLNMCSKKVTGVKSPIVGTDVVTLEYLERRLSRLENQGDVVTPNTILSGLYPVGSIYISTNPGCPLSALIPGSTWEEVPGSYYLKSAGSAAATAGEKSDGRTTFTKDDFKFSTNRATAIIRDKGHKEAYFIQGFQMEMAANAQLVPPSYSVHIWKRI